MAQSQGYCVNTEHPEHTEKYQPAINTYPTTFQFPPAPEFFLVLQHFFLPATSSGVRANARVECGNPASPLLGETFMNTLRTIVLCLLLGLPARTDGAEPAAFKKTALDDYVAQRDPTYSWKLVKTIRG